MSDPRRRVAATDAEGISVVRTAIAAVLFVGGLAYAVFYALVAADGEGGPSWMTDLGDWNFLIGFGVMFVGLMAAAHRRTPLGRGRGVVWGMLGSFIVGLLWIVIYYLTIQDFELPVIAELGNYNLLVGIGFMATGFVFATKWE